MLRAIKLAHTVIWALFAGCIVALPFVAWQGKTRIAWVLIAIVSVECIVLFANRFRCPLTDLAAHHTDDRRPDFDIYLPECLARYNKQIFGALFVFGILLTIFLETRPS